MSRAGCCRYTQTRCARHDTQYCQHVHLEISIGRDASSSWLSPRQEPGYASIPSPRRDRILRLLTAWPLQRPRRRYAETFSSTATAATRTKVAHSRTTKTKTPIANRTCTLAGTPHDDILTRGRSKKSFNVESPSFTPAAIQSSAAAKKATFSAQVAGAAAFTPRNMGSTTP